MQIVSICMKCQMLFSGEKIRKNIINLSSDELASGMVKVNDNF